MEENLDNFKIEASIRNYIINTAQSNKRGGNISLPSENELSKLFNVSRHTVRKIYSNLEKLGLVHPVQGVGRFMVIKEPKINLDLTETSFTKKMKEQNIPLTTLNLGLKKVTGEELVEAKREGLMGNIYKVSRLRKLYNIPSAIHNSYISDYKFPQIEKEGSKILSIYEYYKSKDIKDFKISKSTLSVDLPTIEEIEILKVGSLVPILVLEGKLLDKEGSLIEIIKTEYRSDIFKYSLE
ncbi:MAG: GntR family transcriptional regulator [Peptoniphilus lacydonensis]|uniref:GntR family transcriptional regulator n=1 Tax=Peptoniphilaceae TaxID=1570339 RepID=UPI000287F90E|nr:MULTISPECIES: GntR family transcriptional regulator [Peptoniphilus]MDU1954294.1 GntR family transcriptional regulator [Peptoniphilus lacydonensis]MDU5274757.1 GntR family transcriptional regulator [Peptoniphilus lacydonensis]